MKFDGYIDPKLVKYNSKYKAAFKIESENLNAITKSIIKSGYDKSTPIVLERGTNYILDGHTRTAAAIKAGIIRIPFVYKDIETEEQGLKYITHLQTSRRNLKDEQIIRLIFKSAEYLEAKNKKKWIAENFNLSLSKAGQIMAILKDGNKVERVLKGESAAIVNTRHTVKQNSPIISACNRILNLIEKNSITADELEALDGLRRAIIQVKRASKTA